MNIPVHDRILWYASELVARSVDPSKLIADPRTYFPLLARGSWMNDTNQATLFTDRMAGVVNPIKKNGLDDLFRELWVSHLEHNILGEMEEDNAPASAKSAAGAFRQSFDQEHGEGDGDADALARADDFSSYENTDHFDILIDSPNDEYRDWSTGNRQGRAKTLHITVNSAILDRVRYSTIDQQDEVGRLKLHSLSELGRALHTVADFYAHTNYIELLLWCLAWKGDKAEQLGSSPKLPSRVVDGFNKERFLLDSAGVFKNCPLPQTGEEVRKLTGPKTIMWFGSSPRKTPLVSSLFDTQDTVYSLLKMYASRLEQVRTDDMDSAAFERNLSVAMAVFDIPGDVIPRKLFTAAHDIQQVLKGIGDTVRTALAGHVRERANACTDNTEKGFLNGAADYIQAHGSIEADEWAKAARLRYVGYTTELELSKSLEPHQGQDNAWQLPHHSLLAKDELPHGSEDVLRYRLACVLATEVTAKLLEWHFAKAPTPEETTYKDIAAKYFVHPWLQLREDALDTDRLMSLIDLSYSYGWSRLADFQNTVVRS